MNNAFPPNLFPPGRPVAIRSSGHQSAFKIILGIFFAMIAALLGLIVLLLIGAETGPVQLLIGLLCACLPVPLYVMLLRLIDRYESEPLWMLCTAFFWGAAIAVFFAFVLNTVNEAVVGSATNSARIGANFGAVISAPIVEESSKALILFAFFFFKIDQFDGVTDGIIYT